MEGTSKEFDGGIAVSWREPDLPALEYVVEVGNCFADDPRHDLSTEPGCVYYAEAVSGGAGPIFNLHLPHVILKKDADVYSIRVTGHFDSGLQSSEETIQQFWMDVSDLSVLQTGEEIEISWKNGVKSSPLMLAFVLEVQNADGTETLHRWISADAMCNAPIWSMESPHSQRTTFHPFTPTPCSGGSYDGECVHSCKSDTTCSTNGRCSGRTGECMCYEGWSGDDCSVLAPSFTDDDEEATHATNRGTCTPGADGCITTCVMESTCSSNGRCNGITGECMCYDGWAGKDCSEPCEVDAVSGECVPTCHLVTTCNANG